MASFLRKRGQSETEHSAPVNVGHVRLAHGAFVRSVVFTVAILAQGTNRGDALCAALLLRRVGSNPTATSFRFWTFSSICARKHPIFYELLYMSDKRWKKIQKRNALTPSSQKLCCQRDSFLRPAIVACTVTSGLPGVALSRIPSRPFGYDQV